MRAPRVPVGIPKALTEPEVNALLGAVPGDDPRALRDRARAEPAFAAQVDAAARRVLELKAKRGLAAC